MKKSKKTRKPTVRPQPGSLPGKEEGGIIADALGNASKFTKPPSQIEKLAGKADKIEG